MVQKTYRSRASKKPFYAHVSAFALAFLLAFSPLQIFAQQSPIKEVVEYSAQATQSTTSEPSKEVLGTSIETRPDIEIKPDEPVKEDPTLVDPKPNPEKEEPSKDDGTRPTGDDGHDEEDPEEENRDNGAPTPTVQTQVVSENVKREKTVNLKDGSLSYEYQLSLPPGRNSLTPEVSLVYSSNNRKVSSISGIGWSLDIPYIERVNKTGSEKLYTDDHFSSSVTGELVLDAGTAYVSKVDNGEFISYEYDNDFWIAYDKDGTKYTFGENTSSRQDDPNDPARIYKWMIEEIRDTNDNYIKYEYHKDSGQIYPSVITYTGNGATDGIFEVIFERESVPRSLAQNDTGFKVTTNERIHEIRTEVDSNWVRKYELAYTTGDNTEEILLDTITESGIDENSSVVSRDPIDFDYTDATSGWTYDAGWNSPMSFIEGSDYGMRMADINGDALIDIVCYRDEVNTLCNDNNPPAIYLNDGDGFDSSSGWSVQIFVDDQGGDLGVRLIDVNGDGLNDIVRARDTAYNEVYINDGSDWVLDTNWSLPLPVVNSGKEDYGMRMADFNGDGLVDIICQNDNTNGYCNNSNVTPVFFNTGSGWDPGSWGMPEKQDDPGEPESFIDDNGNDNALHISDINGDGLADLIRGEGADMYIYINTGSGWEYDIDWEQPLPFVTGGEDLGMRLEDINADGLVDIICQNDEVNGYCNNNNATPTYLNNGYGWNSVTWGMPGQYNNSSEPEIFADSNGGDNGLRLIDINGDGVTDLARGDGGDNFTYLSNSTTKSDLLSKITYPEGGFTEVSYKGTPQFLDYNGDVLNPKLPMVNIVVSETQDDDNNGNVETHEYVYAGGEYYFNDHLNRKFAGFAEVSVADVAGNVTKTYFHQGNDTNDTIGEYDDQPSKIGKVYRVERYDNNDNLFDLTINKWEEFEIVPDANFVYQTASTSLTYDGDTDHKDKAVEYDYNTANGNLTTKTSWGEVTADVDGTFSDIGSDQKTEEYEYAVDANGLIKSKVSVHTVNDQNLNIVSKEKLYYDNENLGDVTTGNPTKEERLISTGNYSTKEMVYDGVYGLVVESIDPLNNSTIYDYDSYNLYPEGVTNALSQETTYTYDYSSGKPVNITDPNGTQKEYVYDGFDRVLEEKESSPTSASTLVLKNEYAYDDTSGAIEVTKTEHLDSSLNRDIHQYFDGLGRLIQERAKAEDSNTFNVKDTTYDPLGRVSQQSLPYEDTGSSLSGPTNNGDLYIAYMYDPLGRVVEIQNVIGITYYIYDDWKTTITNQKGVPKDLYKDAYDNLIQVDEHNDSNIYETRYTWDLNGKLLHIEDALGNIRNFEYDNLGRRTMAEDLHDSGDSDYGIWNYSYDDAGNLEVILDPNGTTTTRVYDELNRISTEDSDTSPVTDVSYVYDSCTNGIGKVCEVEDIQGVITEYSYLENGLLDYETRDINSSIFEIGYIYDRQGNIATIRNPDRSTVEYTRNEAGLVEKIEEMEDGGSLADFVSDIDYSPTGVPGELVYANGVTTTNDYDETKMYRLVTKVTTNGTDDLQNIYYEYDDMNNVVYVADTSDTTASKEANYTYDDLDRLLTAVITGTGNSQDYTLEYEYDPIGNITNHSVLGQYQYQGNGSTYANPHAVTDIGLTVLEYDMNGNLTGDGVMSNNWSYRNEILETNGPNGTLSFLYDHSGDRMYVNDGTNDDYYPSKFYNDIAGIPTKNIYLDDTLVGTIEDSGLSAIYHYNHADHLTGSNVTSDSVGALEQTLDYYPFGESRINDQVTSFDQGRKYAGSVYDTESGYSYMGARYYDGRLGRFTSQDPVFQAVGDEQEIKEKTKLSLEKYLSDPQGLNSYSYARNNPLKLIDPQGEWFKEVMTGQQNWSDFVVEVGQATNQMTQDSKAWNFAVNHPLATGAITALASVPAVLSGEAAAAAFGMAAYPGVGATFSAQHAVAGAIYSGLTISGTLAVPEMVSPFSKGDPNNPASFYPAAFSVAKEVGLSVTGRQIETIGATTEIIKVGGIIGESVTSFVNSLFTSKSHKNNTKIKQ